MIDWMRTKKKASTLSEKVKSYFTLFESLLAPRSNPLLVVAELCFAKQGSMDSGEFHAPVVKITVRDTIFSGMNSTWARDKAINLMNEEGKEIIVEFPIQQLALEDCNAQHKSLSQLDSTTSVNFAAYDHRQNRGKSNISKQASGKNQGQNNSGAHGSSNSSHQYRKPQGMEGKCMRCGKPDHQLGQKCPAKNAKCKDCHKIGHFHKVCQTKKRARQTANLVQTPTQDDDDTYIDKKGVRQPNPPRVNMFKLVNHIEATKGSQGKHLKFSITKHPKGPYKHQIVVRVDTGADVNCMNEKTFKIREIRGEKYLNTFIVSNVNDCPNLLSYGATFRMGV